MLRGEYIVSKNNIRTNYIVYFRTRPGSSAKAIVEVPGRSTKGLSANRLFLARSRILDFAAYARYTAVSKEASYTALLKYSVTVMVKLSVRMPPLDNKVVGVTFAEIFWADSVSGQNSLCGTTSSGNYVAVNVM